MGDISSMSSSPRILTPGIYCPTQVFFDPQSEDLDLSSIEKHTLRLAKAGIHGIVTNGSNGEAAHLTAHERFLVTQSTRSALDKAGFSQIPIIVGASDQTVRGTLQLCNDAKKAGGDAVLLLTPSFFKWAMTPSTIERYFTKVADASPLPIVIYNYPGAIAGIDLDSELLIRLAKHPNIVGTKFTCGNVGKLARVAEATEAVCEILPSKTQSQGQNQKRYMAFSGIADIITPSLAVGSSGAIVGAANVFPRACVNVYNLYISGKYEEAIKAQARLATADWALTKRAIPGFKAILQHFEGYGGKPREPMPELSPEGVAELIQEVTSFMEFEKNLA